MRFWALLSVSAAFWAIMSNFRLSLTSLLSCFIFPEDG